jgi:plastocyanin
VTETEYSISLPSATLTPGTYTFAVDNSGTASHDLVIKGPGVDSAKTSQLKRGDKGEVTVTLQPGKYDLWCSVGNHKARGMQTTITVS